MGKLTIKDRIFLAYLLIRRMFFGDETYFGDATTKDGKPCTAWFQEYKSKMYLVKVITK